MPLAGAVDVAVAVAAFVIPSGEPVARSRLGFEHEHEHEHEHVHGSRG